MTDQPTCPHCGGHEMPFVDYQTGWECANCGFRSTNANDFKPATKTETEIDYKELKEAEAAATPGDWFISHGSRSTELRRTLRTEREEWPGFRVVVEGIYAEADARLIALARTAVPELLAEVERLTQVLRDEQGCRQLEIRKNTRQAEDHAALKSQLRDVQDERDQARKQAEALAEAIEDWFAGKSESRNVDLYRALAAYKEQA